MTRWIRVAIPAEDDFVALIALSGVRPCLDRMIEHIISFMHPLLNAVAPFMAIYAEPRLVASLAGRRVYLGGALMHLGPARVVIVRLAGILVRVKGQDRAAYR